MKRDIRSQTYFSENEATGRFLKEIKIKDPFTKC